jgi:hypothetical protein
MRNVDRIRTAEDKVADVQRAIALVQAGLENAEAVAVVAERTGRRLRRTALVLASVLGIAVALYIARRSARVADARSDQT